MDEVHKQGLIHRDISPDNIMLLENGKVKLMDFGAARDYTEFGEKSLSIVLKPGYAPEEQYRTRGIQGPWTDIYAYSATLYKCLTGITPEESMQRVIEDSLKSPSDLGLKIPAGMEYAIMKGLAVFQKDRYQNLKDYCQDLYSETGAVEQPAPVSAPDLSEKSKRKTAEKANVSSPDKQKGKGGKNKILILVAAVVIIVLLIIFLGRGGNGISSSPDDGNSNFEVLDKK